MFSDVFFGFALIKLPAAPQSCEGRALLTVLAISLVTTVQYMYLSLNDDT